jgi:hypothetical protein
LRPYDLKSAARAAAVAQFLLGAVPVLDAVAARFAELYRELL